MSSSGISIAVPTIRLENTGHKYAEIKLYEEGRLISKEILEIYGNELGETVSGCSIPITISGLNSCNLKVEIICDGDVIYDSGKSLHKRFWILKNGKEASISGLKPGRYEIYAPYVDSISFEEVDVFEKGNNYLDICLNDDYAIYYNDRLVAMDTSNIREVTISEPEFVEGCHYVTEEDECKIALVQDSFSIYLDRERQGNSIRIYCGSEEIELTDYWKDGDVCEIPLSSLSSVNNVLSISIVSLEKNAVIYEKHFLVLSNLSISFNKDCYVMQDDYDEAFADIRINEEMQRHNIQIGEKVIVIEYEDGSIKVDVPAMTYHWNNIDNIYPGENVWIDDIKQGAELEINCSSELDFEVEIGDERFSDSKIDLFAIAEQERSKASYNYPVTVSVQNHRYTLGQIIFSEMFIRMPVFTFDEQFIYWDGGISFIGNRNKRIRLDLYDEENQAYSLNLKFDDNKIELPEDFVDGEYTYSIVLESEDEELILAQETQFFGNPNKYRFENKVIEIFEVTEDVEEGTKPQEIKPVYIENIKFIERNFLASEDGIFDIYEGQMFFVRPDGSKKYYSRKYYTNKQTGFSFYKINPVKIIYINEKLLRIVNEDDEGLYCYDNFGTSPRLEITDREPRIGAKNYKDILFYLYGSNVKRLRAQVTTPVISTSSNVRNDFEKYVEIDQREVIEADVSRRMIINAGPGTGKTWTLIEKIINLVDVQEVDPETILVLCFSKAAVEVVKNRLKKAADEERVSEVINLVDIRTFDSFASQVLYWVKDESEYDNLQYYDIGKLNYDERINLFTSTITDLPELMEQCCHLFVDEVQDLVKERARMVLAIIRNIPEPSGVTLLGDACQSIYDYQARNDRMTSKQFYSVMANDMPKFAYYTFTRNYRQEDELAYLGDGYRKHILSGRIKDCDSYWHNDVEKRIHQFKEYDADKITQNSLRELLDSGTVGILTRTNGQALKISAALKEKGINHVLKKRLRDNTLNKWIALVFNDYELTSVDEDDFTTLYNQIADPEDAESYEVWNAIKEAARVSSERIGVRDILKGVMTNSRSMVLYSHERVSGLTVTNIHRGKGREFDAVLVENDIFSEDEKELEEHKVCYVALTRPKREIYRINAKADYIRIDKEGDRRCFKSDYVGYNKQRLTYFEVTGEPDIDLRSFVRESGAQLYIRENYDDLVGKKIVLIKDKHKSEFVRYKIVLVEDNYVLGYTSKEFYESLSRALHIVYKLPSRAELYFNVYPERFTDIYVDDVISVIDQLDGSEMGVKAFGEMVTWNAVTIVGYSKAEY
ncbi:UvrD-helicase domain-containing protein [Clostridium sp. AM54-37XD]|uniref:UvrD-helicase domain-containing protein n=1 Tax=Clostridium sp. AM54-37XD TaxID=2293038 RepID=UPI0011C22557|nr:UvrD-helicase domain-containing protein [Clostridium sp. AM54-37XD]